MPITRAPGAAAFLLCLAAPLAAQQPRPEDTEVWTPVPPVVAPGTGTAGATPPSDAVVLIGKGPLTEWVQVSDGSPARWPVREGVVTVDKAAGDIQTRRRFRDYQLHLEWRVPAGITGEGQGRGNSGLFLALPGGDAGGYELQILDSFGDTTLDTNEAGAIYLKKAPDVNAATAPETWQTYDVTFRAARFDADGTKTADARVTVVWNGQKVHDDITIDGPTGGGRPEGPSAGAIRLQDHGNKVRYRNIWVEPLN